MTCADCCSPAVWLFNDRGALPVQYCDKCLPRFLRSRARAGQLSKVVVEAPPTLEPEPVEEAPPAWVPEPEPAAPRKRRTRKTAPEA